MLSCIFCSQLDQSCDFLITLLLFDEFISNLPALQLLQGGLLQEEIQKLKDKINNLNSYFEFYESESNKLESALAKKHSDYNDLRKQRDKLQEERKYVYFLTVMAFWFNGRSITLYITYSDNEKCPRSFWMEEANVTAEKDRLKENLVNAKEKLGNATPGVWKCYIFFHTFLFILLTAMGIFSL